MSRNRHRLYSAAPMVSAAEVALVRSAYHAWQSLPVTYQFGPIRIHSDRVAAVRLWKAVIEPAVARVNATMQQGDNGVYTSHAPSPWHAYFHLYAQQLFGYIGGLFPGAPPRDHNKQPAEHTFFRGQRCANWPFGSSLRRLDGVTQARETRAVLALEEYFRTVFLQNDDIASNTARCFAQHYGIATDLADISCDADVAIWFATHPAGKRCPDGEKDAVVRAVSWAGQRDLADTMVLLPPPFVRNAYLQRGLFIDTSRTDGVLRGRIILDVRFPRKIGFGEFDVIRNRRRITVWPTPDRAEKELVRWARRLATQCATAEEVRRKVQSVDADSLPRFWLKRELFDFERQWKRWLAILDWMLPATCVTASPLSNDDRAMQYEINEEKVRALARSNPTFFRVLVDGSEGADFTNFEVTREILSFARKALDHRPGA